MKKLYWIISSLVAFLLVAMSCELNAQQRYHQSELNLSDIKETLYSLEKDGEAEIELPNHMGNWRQFTVRESNILDESVRTRRADYRSFTIVDKTNPVMKGRLSVSQFGIQAIVLTPFGTIYIEPDGQLDAEHYFIYLNENPLASKRGAPALPSCAGAEKTAEYTEPVRRFNLRDNSILEFGDVTRTYDIAIVATADFFINNGSSVPMSETVIFNTMNSVQAIYGFDLKVEFNVLDPFVYTNPNTHPFTGENRPKEAADAVNMHFNTANYDIGHVFHNQTDSDVEGSGGVAGLGVVCKNFPWQGGPGVAKAAGWSGAQSNLTNGWIRLTAHEIGHMFDATHTFNGSGENCDDGAFSPTTNYEIGSGTTIMSYQGICSPDQNIPSSGTADNYFHANSLEQMVNYILNDGGCASTSSPENTPPSAIADPCGSSHVVPMSTPFYLVGEGEDLDGDVLTYTWEQFDNDGPTGPTWGKLGASAASDPLAPIFRSYPPSTSPVRMIPSLKLLLDGDFSSSFEPLPSVEREITFRLTVRDQEGGIGMDEMTVNVENAGPLELNSPKGGDVLDAGEMTSITWDVNGTDAFCDEVNLTLSIDGGLSYPISLAEAIPNNGSASVVLPSGVPQSTKARLKVSCANNPCVVFFSISDGDFEIESDCEALPSSICPLNPISGDPGDAAFNLDLEFFPGQYISSKVFSTVGGGPIYTITSESLGGGCLEWNGTAAYDILEFSVTQSGDYSFSIQGFGGNDDFRLSNVFEGSFDPDNPCDSWVASNAFEVPGNSISGFGTYSVPLESCKTYFITLARFFGEDPFTNTINFSGPGEIIEVEALPGTNAYTYIAVNSNTNIVASANSTADFTGLGGGEYCVWGVMYKESGSIPPANLDPNDFVGQELGELLSLGNCMLTSYECKPLSITLSEVCDASFQYDGVSSLESAPFNSVKFCKNGSNPTPIVGGNSGGTFSSNSADIEIDENTGQINLQNSIAGTYIISYQDDTDEGCEESIEVVIADSPNATAGNNGPLCEGEELELSADGGTSYSWTGPDGFTSDQQDPVIADVSLAGGGDYTVVVTDDNGCTAEETTSVVVIENPQVTATNEGPYCEGQTIELSADGGTSYQWSGPDGFSSSDQNPTVSNASTDQQGDYSVVVTDDNGCTAEGLTSVEVNENPQATASNSGPYCEGESIELQAGGGTSYSWTGPDGFTSSEQDVEITDSSPDNGGDYTVEVTDDNGCTAEEVTTVVINENPQATASNDGPICLGRTIRLTADGGVDYEWSGPDGFSSTDQNPTIEDAAVSNEGEYTVLVTDSNNCTASAVTTVSVRECITISGSVTREGDGAALNNVDVNLSGDVLSDRITNTDGDFSFELSDGEDFTLTPSKEIDKFNGVELVDALIIQQHLNDINTIDNPYKLIAADINQDDVIDELDILTKFSVILRDPAVDAEFPNSWRFIPSDFVFPDPLSPWGFPQTIDLVGVLEDMDNQNFTGIKIGDLNFSADPSESSPEIPSRGNIDDLEWKVIDQSWMETDQLIDVIFTAGYFQDFAAYQFGVNFDISQLEYVATISGSALTLPPESIGEFDVVNGELRMLWLSSDGLNTSLDGDTEVLTLRFRSLTPEGTISDHLNIDDEVLDGIVYNEDLLEAGIVMEFIEEDTVFTRDLGGEGLDLLPNRPNPFNHFTTIEFVLPQSGEATLRIMDIRGSEIYRLDGMFPRGHNEVRFDWNYAPGVYFYELITPYGTMVRKMIAQ